MFITAAELKTHLYGEVTNEIDRADTGIAEEAISSAIAEASGYLSAYDRTAIFAAVGAARNASLLTFIKDIAVWHFIQLANPGISLALRQDRYEKAIRWFDKVQSGKVVPDLPYPSPVLDAAGNTIIAETYMRWGSNKKRQNNY